MRAVTITSPTTQPCARSTPPSVSSPARAATASLPTTITPTTSASAPATTAVAPMPGSDALAGVDLSLAPFVQLPAARNAMAWRTEDDALYIAGQRGQVWRLIDGVVQPDLVLDLTQEVAPNFSELGLLGIAFSPIDRRLYVDFTDTNIVSHVVSFIVTDGHALLSTPSSNCSHCPRPGSVITEATWSSTIRAASTLVSVTATVPTKPKTSDLCAAASFGSRRTADNPVTMCLLTIPSWPRWRSPRDMGEGVPESMAIQHRSTNR